MFDRRRLIIADGVLPAGQHSIGSLIIGYWTLDLYNSAAPSQSLNALYIILHRNVIRWFYYYCYIVGQYNIKKKEEAPEAETQKEPDNPLMRKKKTPEDLAKEAEEADQDELTSI